MRKDVFLFMQALCHVVVRLLVKKQQGEMNEERPDGWSRVY
jgi:hypothetical protein